MKKYFITVWNKPWKNLEIKLCTNQGRNYVWKSLNICIMCKHWQSRSHSYSEKSNLPGYRANRTIPLQVFVDDYLRPVFVKDIYYSSSDEMHKACITLFTCSTSRAVVLELAEDNISKNFINNIKKFIASRDCPKNIVSDNWKVFISPGNPGKSFCTEQGIITWNFSLEPLVGRFSRRIGWYGLESFNKVDWKWNNVVYQ